MRGLESRAKIAEMENAKAVEEKETAKNQNENIRREIAAKEADVKNLEQMRDAGREELKDAKKEHDELAHRLQAAESQMTRLNSEIAQIKRDYERLVAENKSLQLRAERQDQEIMAQESKKQSTQRGVSSVKPNSDN